MVITLTSFTFISCEEEAASAICNTDTAYNNYLEAITSFSSNPTKSNWQSHATCTVSQYIIIQ